MRPPWVQAPGPIAAELDAIRGRMRLHTSWCAIEDRQALLFELDRLRALCAKALGERGGSDG